MVSMNFHSQPCIWICEVVCKHNYCFVEMYCFFLVDLELMAATGKPVLFKIYCLPL